MTKGRWILIAGLFLGIALIPTGSVGQQVSAKPEPSKAPNKGNLAEPQPVPGTDGSPITVKVLPTPKTQEESAEDKQTRQDQSSANWWMVRLTFVLCVIGIIQAVVFWIQARRLRETIVKMDDIAKGQTADMAKSIAEAARSAASIQQVASSMEVSVTSVKESVKINREIADRQKLITELQSRAYLSVEFLEMVPQNAVTGVRFEPRVTIFNRGNTPAYKVRFRVRADAVPFPIQDSFRFTLPDFEQGGSVSIIAAGTHKILTAVVPELYSEPRLSQIRTGVDQRVIMWGIVTFEDAFNIERFIKFAMTFFWLGDGKTVMSSDTSHHNDSN